MLAFYRGTLVGAMFLASVQGISATLLGIGRVSLYLMVMGASIKVCVVVLCSKLEVCVAQVNALC